MTLILRTYALYHRNRRVLIVASIFGFYCVGQLFVSLVTVLPHYDLGEKAGTLRTFFFSSVVCHISYEGRVGNRGVRNSCERSWRARFLRCGGPTTVSYNSKSAYLRRVQTAPLTSHLSPRCGRTCNGEMLLCSDKAGY